MKVRAAVDQEIRDLIHQHGRITFAQFMQVCLYSLRGGFYSSRGTRINTHFGTSSTSHPVFGALIARQLEQMWHLLGDPPVFHVIEVGSGDGALAQSIGHACGRMAPRFAEALYYVAADYEPRWFQSSNHPFAWDNGTGEEMSPSRRDALVGIQGVKTAGLRAFRNVVGCILCNELIDNLRQGSLRHISGRESD
jgi:SAM-dependent MidA family methyltransferase